MSLLWRFVSLREDGPFRYHPYDSLMEANSDAWLIQWRDEMENSAIGETMCGPMLVDFADELAWIMNHSHTDGWEEVQKWADMAKDGRYIEGARGAMRQFIEMVKCDNEPYVRALLLGFCSKARGSLR